MPGMDTYFLSNQSDKKIEIKPRFRVTGLRPQMWDAVTGEIRVLNEYEQTSQGTSVPLVLEPGQSQFVVFTNQTAADVHDGYPVNCPSGHDLMTVDGPWTVVFDNPVIDVRLEHTFDRLSDWTRSDNPAIKYYAGTARYSAEFRLDAVPGGKDVRLNLGQVGVMAEVIVNGRFAGSAWMYPYVVNVTDLLRPGKNMLEIEVVNLWRNTLVKEKSLPEDQQKTWLVVSDVKESESLQPSGLIGPVTLETMDRK
jgi:hypothetical protein